MDYRRKAWAAEYLSHTQESVQLAVVDTENANEVARMVGPTTSHLFGRTGCSVLVVRS
jgi:hypothetical protein